jgi:hypothetical protein
VKENGMTLVELVLVIAIIIILAGGVLKFSFEGWQAGYNVESQMKQMYIDLMNARTRAMDKNRVHFVLLSATQYKIQEDIDPWPDGDGCLKAGDSPSTLPTGYTDPVPLMQINLDSRYPIVWSAAGDPPACTGSVNPPPRIQFDAKGYSYSTRQICSNTAVNTDYNCIEITESRIKIGKLTTKIPPPYNGVCDATNCIAK